MRLTREVLVNVSAVETRVAVVEQGLLQELHIERMAHRGLVGNIYLGKVIRVMPGLQTAFVDIGEQRSGFLQADDTLRQGQSILVQVSKEPQGDKGARLTRQLSLSSRYLVYLPGTSHIGISQQLEPNEERVRLRQVLQQAVAATGITEADGFIIRTAAEGVGVDALTTDIDFLNRTWQKVLRCTKAASCPECVHQEWSLGQRSLRDLVGPRTERVVVDNEEAYQLMNAFCEDHLPELVGQLELYSGKNPLFDGHGIEEEIVRGLGRRIELKSGGYLVIDQTEAMTTIDVNTGSFVGRNNQAETILQTNLEAASSAARQLRLRNLGGIIILDFIDMQSVEHRQQLMRALAEALSRDSAGTVVTGLSDLGLVEMTRKRERESLGHYLCAPCPHCDGRGELKSAETVCYDIFREMLRDHRVSSCDTLLIQATQAVVDKLQGDEAAAVADLAEFIGKTVQFRVDPVYSREQFDIIRL